MWLSELHGRLGQILREHGDMEVVRCRSLKIDGVIGSDLNNFIDYTSECFNVLIQYTQKQIGENTIEERKIRKRLIIEVP